MKTIKMLLPVVLALGIVHLSWAAPKSSDVPPLIEKLKKGDARSRAEAAKELGHIGEVKAVWVKDAVPLLLEAAKEKDMTVKLAALTALGQVSPDPKAAIPIFVDALKVDDDKVKLAAVQGLTYLGKVEPEDAAPALEEMRKVMSDIKKLDKDAQKKKNALTKAMGGAMNSLQGKAKKQ